MEHVRKLFEMADHYLHMLLSLYPSDSVSDTQVYYMNGNDSTAFDWEVNDRFCEFGIFRDDDFYYLKMLVSRSGRIETYLYRGDDRQYFHRPLAEAIDLEEAAKVIAKAESGFKIGLDTKDWDLPIDQMLRKMQEHLPEA